MSRDKESVEITIRNWLMKRKDIITLLVQYIRIGIEVNLIILGKTLMISLSIYGGGGARYDFKDDSKNDFISSV